VALDEAVSEETGVPEGDVEALPEEEAVTLDSDVGEAVPVGAPLVVDDAVEESADVRDAVGLLHPDAEVVLVLDALAVIDAVGFPEAEALWLGDAECVFTLGVAL
jgi:hypothetical protein